MINLSSPPEIREVCAIIGMPTINLFGLLAASVCLTSGLQRPSMFNNNSLSPSEGLGF